MRCERCGWAHPTSVHDDMVPRTDVAAVMDQALGALADATRQSHHAACRAAGGRDIGSRCTCFVGRARDGAEVIRNYRKLSV